MGAFLIRGKNTHAFAHALMYALRLSRSAASIVWQWAHASILMRATNFVSKPLAQIVWVHGVKLPTALTVISLKPGIAWVAALGFNAERRQSVSAIGPGQSDARYIDHAAIFFDAARQIDIGHIHSGRVQIADVENFEVALADRLFRDIMG
jgi:hypothetical protein